MSESFQYFLTFIFSFWLLLCWGVLIFARIFGIGDAIEDILTLLLDDKGDDESEESNQVDE